MSELCLEQPLRAVSLSHWRTWLASKEQLLEHPMVVHHRNGRFGELTESLFSPDSMG